MQQVNYAVVEPNSNRCIAVIDLSLIPLFESQFPNMEIKPVLSIGSTSFGNGVSSISIVTNKGISTDYHMITRFPEQISLGEAYKSINNK
jgi:hypothetical protein